jgi:hypothetical protein
MYQKKNNKLKQKKKDSETIEICTEIRRNRTKSDPASVPQHLPENHRTSLAPTNCENSTIKYLSEVNERIKSDVVYDSMKSYLSNITNIAVDSVYPNDESEQDDETSIQEIIKLNLTGKSKGKLICTFNLSLFCLCFYFYIF